MTATREEAAQKAESDRTNSPGTCQLWTRTLYGAPSAGDQDHDGDADAVDGWASEPRTARHPGDRNPPRGVPVAWDGGSHGYGHRAISLGGGKIRSTDAGGSGKVATVDLSWPEQHWGLHYLGWSETIDGQPIPDAAPTPKPDGLRVDLVDISHYQDGKVDYAAAKKAGVKGGYHKATEGTAFVDPNYSKRRAEFAAAGLPFGAYHFARPSSSSGAAQADHFLKTAGVKPGDLAPMLDLEDDGGLAKANLTSWVGAFVRHIHKATGVRPIIYTHFDLSDAHHCKLWVARYSDTNAAPVVPAPWTAWDVRQFSDGKYGKPNSVAGFGHVDLDMMRDGLTIFDITVLANGGPVPTPDPTPPPVPKPKPTQLRGGTFNLEFGRKHRTVADEVTRALSTFHIDFLAVQEAGDYLHELERIPGYQYFTDRTSHGTAQVGILVREGVTVTHPTYRSLGDGWKTITGKNHEPAVFPRVTLDKWLRVAATHMPTPLVWNGDTITGPPERIDDYLAVAAKVKRLLGSKLRRPKARLVAADWNEKPETTGQWSPAWIAGQVGASIAAPPGHQGHDEIDYPVWINCRLTGLTKQTGFAEGSDHDLVTFDVERP